MGSILALGRSSGEGMTTHSSILAWKIPWTEKLGGLEFMETESDMTEHKHIYVYKSFSTTLDKSLRKNNKNRQKNWKT